MLESRTAAHQSRFTNAGVNGDLAYNALQRLDAVIELRADVVTGLIGTNDANASLTEQSDTCVCESTMPPLDSVVPSLTGDPRS